jgi:hypothetical protein
MFLKVALSGLLEAEDLNDHDMIVVLAGNFSRGSGSSYIEVGSVEYLKERAGQA